MGALTCFDPCINYTLQPCACAFCLTEASFPSAHTRGAGKKPFAILSLTTCHEKFTTSVAPAIARFLKFVASIVCISQGRFHHLTLVDLPTVPLHERQHRLTGILSPTPDYEASRNVVSKQSSEPHAYRQRLKTAPFGRLPGMRFEPKSLRLAYGHCPTPSELAANV